MVGSSEARGGHLAMPPPKGARSIFLIATSSIEQHGYKAHRTGPAPVLPNPGMGVQQRSIWLFETPVQEPLGGFTLLFSFEESDVQIRSEALPTTLRLNGAAR